MNLSDLVHRTAGDNKVLTTPTTTTTTTTAIVNGTTPANTLFQQNATINYTNGNTVNMFSNLSRQDPSSFLYSMPNMNQVKK